MYTRFSFFFLIILLPFFSCNRKNRQQKNPASEISRSAVADSAAHYSSIKITTGNERIIHLDPHAKGYTYDELIDSISFVRLQTTDNCLIANINRLYFTEDKIIVVDYFKMEMIYVFDRQGRFLYTLSRQGGAPYEYTTLDYAALTPDQKHVVAVDMGQKLKYYRLDKEHVMRTGSFLDKTVTLSNTFYTVEFLTDDIIAGYCSGGNIWSPHSSDRHLLMLSTLSNKILYSGYKSYYSKNFNFTTDAPIRKCGNKLYFNPIFSDTIYTVSREGLEACYVLDIKGHKKVIIDDGITNESYREQKKTNPYFNSDFLDMDDVALFAYMANLGRPTWGLYIKAEDKTYDCNSYLQDPLKAFCNGPWYYYKGNTAACPVSASSLLANKKSILKKSNPKIATELLDGLTEDDNPVVLFYHMKTKIKK